MQFERKLGDSELSYYLPSRQDGVNDMYLHLGFRAPPQVVAQRRLATAWAILRVRHPLLAAKVHFVPGDYDNVRFIYTQPTSAKAALADAEANLDVRVQCRKDLIDAYLNGPRTLSNERISYLVVSQPPASSASGLTLTQPPLTPPATPHPSLDSQQWPSLPLGPGEPSTAEQQTQQQSPSLAVTREEFDILICAAHFLGDGMALHAFANDLFTLIGGRMNDDELLGILRDEWTVRWGQAVDVVAVDPLPACLEDRLPPVRGRLRQAAAKVDFQTNQDKLIGAHTFPRAKHGPRQTILNNIAFPPATTKKILAKCKANGVSISTALFAVCNFAWARTQRSMAPSTKLANFELPMMMYAAMNLRPHLLLPPSPALPASYWFLAVGYYNVVLPSFSPSSSHEAEYKAPPTPPDSDAGSVLDDTDWESALRSSLASPSTSKPTALDVYPTSSTASIFWHRARQARDQTNAAVKSPLLVQRSLEMARIRGARARLWAREDDEKAAGKIMTPVTPVHPTLLEKPAGEKVSKRPAVPSQALIGLSLLGNLDAVYKHKEFPAVEMHTLTTGSRQRPGGMLLFGYTFASKLWLSLGWDVNGFERPVIDAFWQGVVDTVDEFCLAD